MENEFQQVEAEILGSDRMLEAMTRGEIDQQVATAKKYPRSIEKFKHSVLTIATSDQETAQSCFYAVPRGGKPITGPSVRFAEIIASCYGNLRIASKVITIEDKVVVCEGACHDLENNVAIKVQIRRAITGKAGRRFSDDMIIVTSNAGNSIALRNAILTVVPPALLTNIEKDIRKVGLGDERTLEAKKTAALEYFKGKGIKPAMVYALLECEGEADITLKHLAVLHGFVVAIKEGDTTIEEIFSQVREPGRGPSKVADKITEAKKNNAKVKKAAAPKEDVQAPDKKPEPKKEPEQGGVPLDGDEGMYSRLEGAADMGLEKDLDECLEAAGIESLESIKDNPEKLREVNETFNEKIEAMTNA